MYKDSYNQRLKEIREKYGASVKDTTSCIRSNDKPTLKHDSRNDEKYSDKYSVNKKLYDTKNDWRKSQNVDPSLTGFSSKFSTSIMKETDSFLNTQSKDERLKEIEKIRKEFAQSRNKAVEDFNRNLQKSKQKYSEPQNYTLKERVNRTTATFNPEEFKSAVKEISSNEGYRGRSHSTFNGMRNEPDVKLNQELRRNYDYDQTYDSAYKESKVYDRMDLDIKNLSSYRNSSLNRFDRQNVSVAKREFKDYTREDDFRSIKHIDSETTSPIRGLMKFDSVQKLKKVDVSDNYLTATAAKLSSNTYDLTNIDKIQDRIHKILAKK